MGLYAGSDSIQSHPFQIIDKVYIVLSNKDLNRARWIDLAYKVPSTDSEVVPPGVWKKNSLSSGSRLSSGGSN